MSTNSTREKELKLAKKMKWYRMGPLETDVKIPLTKDEQIAAGAELSDAMHAIADVETEKKAIDNKLKEKIEMHEGVAFDRAGLIRRGFRVETQTLPCFFDPEKQERVYMDIENGEEVKRMPALDGDEQMSIDEEPAA